MYKEDHLLWDSADGRHARRLRSSPDFLNFVHATLRVYATIILVNVRNERQISYLR